MPYLKNLFLLFLFCRLSGVALHAQTDGHSRFPKAVLVQINTEHSRISYLQKHGTAKELKQLRRDAVKVARNMRADFADNFSLYPVYFFADTNLALIKEGKLTGILQDDKGRIIEKGIPSDSLSDYFIIYYGFPVVSQRHTKHIREDSDEPFATRMGRCLVVNNSKMEQLTYVRQKLPRFVFKSIDDPDGKYCYRSPRFDIDYYPLARKLADEITGLPVDFD